MDRGVLIPVGSGGARGRVYEARFKSAWIQIWFPHWFNCATLDKTFLSCLFLICTKEIIMAHR